MKKIICIICPRGCEIIVESPGLGNEVSGYKCQRGREYALNEMTNPRRSITSTVKTLYKQVPRLPVKTDKEIDLKDIFPVMKELDRIEINHPIHSGEIVLSNVLGTGVNIVATSDMYELLGEREQ